MPTFIFFQISLRIHIWRSRLTNHIAAFAVVYGIFLSFGELGPGNCLGMLAAKTGPTAVRGQFYGIAAAVGKVGAFVGTWGMSSFVIFVDSC